MVFVSVEIAEHLACVDAAADLGWVGSLISAPLCQGIIGRDSDEGFGSAKPASCGLKQLDVLEANQAEPQSKHLQRSFPLGTKTQCEQTHHRPLTPAVPAVVRVCDCGRDLRSRLINTPGPSGGPQTTDQQATKTRHGRRRNRKRQARNSAQSPVRGGKVGREGALEQQVMAIEIPFSAARRPLFPGNNLERERTGELDFAPVSTGFGEPVMNSRRMQRSHPVTSPSCSRPTGGAVKCCSTHHSSPVLIDAQLVVPEI